MIMTDLFSYLAELLSFIKIENPQLFDHFVTLNINPTINLTINSSASTTRSEEFTAVLSLSTTPPEPSPPSFALSFPAKPQDNETHNYCKTAKPFFATVHTHFNINAPIGNDSIALAPRITIKSIAHGTNERINYFNSAGGLGCFSIKITEASTMEYLNNTLNELTEQWIPVKGFIRHKRDSGCDITWRFKRYSAGKKIIFPEHPNLSISIDTQTADWAYVIRREQVNYPAQTFVIFPHIPNAH